jgi:hypothetical protein
MQVTTPDVDFGRRLSTQTILHRRKIHTNMPSWRLRARGDRVSWATPVGGPARQTQGSIFASKYRGVWRIA